MVPRVGVVLVGNVRGTRGDHLVLVDVVRFLGVVIAFRSGSFAFVMYVVGADVPGGL